MKAARFINNSLVLVEEPRQSLMGLTDTPDRSGGQENGKINWAR